MLPNGKSFPDQGAMFIGGKWTFIIAALQQLPRQNKLMGKYVEMVLSLSLWQKR